MTTTGQPSAADTAISMPVVAPTDEIGPPVPGRPAKRDATAAQFFATAAGAPGRPLRTAAAPAAAWPPAPPRVTPAGSPALALPTKTPAAPEGFPPPPPSPTPSPVGMPAADAYPTFAYPEAPPEPAPPFATAYRQPPASEPSEAPGWERSEFRAPSDATGALNGAKKASWTPGSQRARPRWALVALVAGLIGALAGGGAATAVARRNHRTTIVRQVIRPNSSIITHQATVQQVLAKVQDAVVSIRTNLGAGTGMIITGDGLVVTNNHVIDKATSITVTLFNSTTAMPATLLGHDATDDVAVIRVDNVSGLPTVTLGDSTKSTVGDDVVAIGNALNLPGGPTVTTGIISAVGRNLPDPRQPQNLLQTDAAINPGNSGGPLVNSSGEVVGMNTLVIQAANTQELAQNLGFAIPVNNIKPLIPDLIKGINRNPGYLGAKVGDMTSQIAGRLGIGVDTGGFVASVDDKGPAAIAGIQANDVVTNFGGKAVTDSSQLVTLIRSRQPGDKVAVTYVRGKATQTTTVTLGSVPPTTP
jgi:S1-C subfamily serine protease